jgi:hypothetical protein
VDLRVEQRPERRPRIGGPHGSPVQDRDRERRCHVDGARPGSACASHRARCAFDLPGTLSLGVLTIPVAGPSAVGDEHFAVPNCSPRLRRTDDNGVDPMSTLDTALAELARVPPKDFTRTRTALTARLREAGDAKAAARVKARRAPTIPVWVVNRLAQDAGEDVGALISASKDLKAAQLGRRAQSESLGEAAVQRRGALDRLLKRARSLLQEAGTAPSHQVLLRVQTLLTAAAADAELQRALRKGEIEQELAAPGFDVFGGAQPQPIGRTAKETQAPKRAERESRATREPSGKARGADVRRREREEQQRQRAEQRQEREAQRRERLASARATLEGAESEAAAATQRLAEAAKALDALLEQVDQARRLRTDRQAEVRRAERAAAAARRALKGAGAAAKR